MLTKPADRQLIGGSGLRSALASAADYLSARAPDIDAINVYPVPDGDTGANMSGTLRDGVAEALRLAEAPAVAEVLTAIAYGALYGARGNSGVILSQALRGFAAAVGEREHFDAAALAAGLTSAASAAYAAVSRPVEGTMLTVLRRAAERASEVAGRLPDGGAGMSCLGSLSEALEAAETAEAATLDQLDSLRAAGVPDAGGEGICVILRGLVAGLTGEPPRSPPLARAEPRILDHDAIAGADPLGFCTEFLVERLSGPIDLARLQQVANDHRNTSVVVVGDEQCARVHVHTDEPRAIIGAAEKMGRLSRLKVEDMSAQNRSFRDTGSGASAQAALLALSRGAGFDAVFHGLGAATSALGDVQKPAVGEIIEAVERLHAAHVILLPNHRDVLFAAQQARDMARCQVHIVPTVSLAQGIAAAFAFKSGYATDANVAAMSEAAAAVRTVEVATATANRTVDGVTVAKGDTVALCDGRVVASGPGLGQALLDGLAAAGAAEAGLITIYYGAPIPADAAEAVRVAAAERFNEVAIELVNGGQELYPYVASVED